MPKRQKNPGNPGSHIQYIQDELKRRQRIAEGRGQTVKLSADGTKFEWFASDGEKLSAENIEPDPT